jgi:serine/threonine-protein kinase
MRSLLSLWRAAIRGRDLFVASIPVTASLFLGGYLYVRAEEAERRQFLQQAQRLNAGMVDRVSQPREILAVLSRFMEVFGSVDRPQFSLLAAPILKRHRDVYALEWLPFVRHAQRGAMEAEARASGLPDYRFWETAPDGTPRTAGARPFYVPIQFMEPPSLRALGFDIASDPRRLATAERARDTGEPAASQPFALIEDVGRNDAAPAVAVYAPVYVERDPATTAERRAALTGFVLVIFRAAPLMDAAASRADAGSLAYMLRDSGAPGAPALAEQPLRWSAIQPREGFRQSFRDQFFDRQWLLDVVPRPGRFEPSLREPGLVVAGGVVAGVLAFAMITLLRMTLRLKRQREKVGPYRLVRRLGHGAMGVVWEARHALLRRPTAVKLLAPGTEGERALARFEREVQLTAGLTHPSTIAIYDYGRTADGIFYYAMELLQGINLQQLVAFEGPLPPARVVYLLRQACGALTEAHAAGLIHRDIKPANLMVCVYGGIPDFVKVLDFGLVKDIAAPDETEAAESVESSPDDTLLSQDGSLLGTPLYMSPEGMSNPTRLDARADIYALGAVGYFLLTGSPPYPGRTAIEIFKLQKHQTPETRVPGAVSEIPASLADTLNKCLSFRRDNRPASAEALDRLLEACAAQLPAPWTVADARAWWQSRGAAALETTRPGPEERESGHAVFPATEGASGSHS